jgi:hypothetical protein
VAVRVLVFPTITEMLSGLTTTELTGATTVIVALSLFPSLVAVIVALPGATAIT